MSAMNGSAARTTLIWLMPLYLIELAHCPSVVCSRGAGKTSPAAHATASNGLTLLKSAFRLFWTYSEITTAFLLPADSPCPALPQGREPEIEEVLGV